MKIILALGISALAPACALKQAVSRRALLGGAVAFTSSSAASAFDLPPLEEFENPRSRRSFAKMPNPPVGKQQSSAFYAVTTGDIQSLESMADAGWALADVKDSAGKRVLHRAAQVGNAPAVKLLIKAGAPVDSVTTWDETPLHFAVRNGHVEAAKELIASGASTKRLTYGGDDALTLAKKYKKTSMVDYLSSL
jgi:hypothetical protein